jgi:hypothetical protein
MSGQTARTIELLRAEEVRSLLCYDADSGLFVWRVGRGNVLAGTAAGGIRFDGYLSIAIRRRHYMAHRLAWLYVHGHWPSGEIDHLNGVRSDNRLSNLRDVSRTTNSENFRGPKSNNKCGFLGVSLHKKTGRWHAKIIVNGRLLSLRYHDTPEAAHAVYLAASAEERRELEDNGKREPKPFDLPTFLRDNRPRRIERPKSTPAIAEELAALARKRGWEHVRVEELITGVA